MMEDTYRKRALRNEIVELMMQCDEVQRRMSRIETELGMEIVRISIDDGQTFTIKNGIETIAEIFGENDPDAYEDEIKGENGMHYKLFFTAGKLFLQEQELSMPVYKKWR